MDMEPVLRFPRPDKFENEGELQLHANYKIWRGNYKEVRFTCY